MRSLAFIPLFAAALCAAAPPIAPPPLEWSLSGAARREGPMLVVDAPPERPGGGATATLDLRPWRGKSFRLTVRAEMEGVARPKFPYEGLKFQFSIYDRLLRRRSYVEDVRQRFGDMAETTLELLYDAAVHDADEAILFLGLQNASGRVCFDLSTLAIEETPSAFTITNQDYIVRYTNDECSQSFANDKCQKSQLSTNVNDNLDLPFVDNGEQLPSVNNAAQRRQPLRGVMSPGCDMTEDDFATLRDWGATLLRYQMTGCPAAAVTNVPAYRAWLRGRLDHLERFVLPMAGSCGMKVIVDVHGVPGGRDGHDWRLFDDDAFFAELIDVWREIAVRFAGDPRIYGYDFGNEPFQTRRHRRDYWQVQDACARAVREIDPGCTVVVESNHMASPYAFAYLSPLAMDDAVYSVHMYDPGTFTHQGVGPGDPRGQTYPGTLENGETLDKEWLRRQLQPVREFQLKHNARILVGEFSAICWAEGADRYIRDCIELFEEYGWDWCYHAFREWRAWSVEHEGPDAGHLVPSADNPRKRALLEGLQECPAPARPRTGGGSVEQTEHPEWNPVTRSDFGIIDREEPVRVVGDLVERLSFSADLENPLSVNGKISARRIVHFSDVADLVEEKRLPDRPDIRRGRKGEHEIGVAKIDFVRAGQSLQAARPVGTESEQAAAGEGVEDFESLVAVGFEFPAEFFEIDRLRNPVGEDHEHFARFADGGRGDFLDGRVVPFKHLGGDLGEPLPETALYLLEERVVSGFEVGLERRHYLDLPADVFGDGRMFFEEPFERYCRNVHAVREQEILAEGESRHSVCDLAPRKVALHPIDPQHRRTGIDEVHRGKGIVEVFYCGLPFRVVVDFVEKHVRPAVRGMVLDEIEHVVRREPKVVERGVEGFRRIRERLPDALEQRRCLAAAARSLDANQPVVPVDRLRRGAVERHGRGGDAPPVVSVKPRKVDGRLVHAIYLRNGANTTRNGRSLSTKNHV